MTTIEQNLVALARSQGALTDEQTAALARFEALGLPAYRSEAYQRTDLPSLLDGAWTHGAQDYDCNMDEALTDGAQFVQLSEYAGTLPHIASVVGDPIAQLATAFEVMPGVIHIPSGVKLALPLELLTTLTASEATLTASRLIIHLEDGAEAEIVSRDRNAGTAPTMSLQSLEIFLGRGAKLRYTDIEESGALSRRISTLHLHQEAESEAYLNFFSLTGGTTRNNYHCDLQGEGAHLSLGGLVISSGSEHVDNYSYIAHSVPHCTSNELFKYVLQDESYGVFTGKILVAVDAQKTLAYQNNRNLLLSPRARMQAKPQLEIYADDVKCSHGMTTGQLSEDALFYMRQRGIALDEAKRMLSIAFSEDVLQLVEREELRDALRTSVEARFAQ